MNGRNYRTFNEIDPNLFRDLIKGSERSAAPEQASSNGIMLPRRPPDAELRTQTESFTEQEGNVANSVLADVARNMGRNADDPERVAQAVTSYNVETMGDPSVDLGEYENLPPLDTLLRLGKGDQTRAALGSSDPLDRASMEGSTRGPVPVSQQQGNQEEPTLNISEELYSPVGPAYSRSQIVRHSYYTDPIEGNGLRGRSRKAGDAPQEVQRAAIESIIRHGKAAGMSDEDIALTLAIARHESGFNPDAAAGTTSAHGLGQFVNDTGDAYGLTDENRWDLDAQARALVEHTQDNIRLAERNGQGREYVYAYHHDGPSLAYGGLGIGRENVMPRVGDYLELVQSYGEE